MKTKVLRQLSLFVCFIALVACNEVNNEVLNDLATVTGMEKGNDPGSTFLLIPAEGCSGCISDASGWAMEHINDKEDIYVIFTRETDLKSLKIKIGESFLSHKRVFVDTFGILNYGSEASIYPQVIHVNEKKGVDVFDFDANKVEYLTLNDKPLE